MTHVAVEVEYLYLAREGMLSTRLAWEGETELFAGSSCDRQSVRRRFQSIYALPN